jgi:hypothetical protein
MVGVLDWREDAAWQVGHGGLPQSMMDAAERKLRRRIAR